MYVKIIDCLMVIVRVQIVLRLVSNERSYPPVFYGSQRQGDGILHSALSGSLEVKNDLGVSMVSCDQGQQRHSNVCDIRLSIVPAARLWKDGRSGE
jgi:hypothetical protein